MKHREPRLPTAVSVVVLTETGPETVRLRNVSRNGGVTYNLPLVVEGGRLTFRIRGRAVSARVVRLGAGDEVGFRFDRPLDPDLMRMLRAAP